MTEYAALNAAVELLAAERSAKPCAGINDCSRSTVFVDGKPVSDGLLTSLAQNLYLHDFGAQATAAGYRSLMLDPQSEFFQRVLTYAACDGMLLLDAGSVLTDEQRRSVDEQVRGAVQAVGRGEVKISRPGESSHPTSGAELAAYERTIRPSVERRVFMAAVSKTADPGRRMHDFVAAALERHRVQFTPEIHLDEADVLSVSVEVFNN